MTCRVDRLGNRGRTSADWPGPRFQFTLSYYLMRQGCYKNIGFEGSCLNITSINIY